MKAIRDLAAVAAIEDEALRELLFRRFAEILIDGETYDPETYGWFLILEPGDDPDAVQHEGCFPLLASPGGDIPYGQAGFVSVFEWVADHGWCYEAIILLSDGGEFISVIVPKLSGVDARLLALCGQLAEAA